MVRSVVFSPEAEAQLADVYRYIAAKSSPEVAARFTSSIVAYCESLQTFSHRGTQRDDIRPALRITNYRKRVVIAFEATSDQVAIIGIFYGGRNYETALRDEEDE